MGQNPKLRLSLTLPEHRRLERLLHEARDVRLYRRLLSLKLLDGGASPAAVARLCGFSRPTLYLWLKRFLVGRRFESLVDHPREGRPRTAPRLSSSLLRRLIRQNPGDLGYSTTGWTVALLAHHLQRQHHIQVSTRTLRRRMHECRLRWKRPRYVYATKAPHMAQKKGGSFAVFNG
jgi:transposase